MAGGGSLGLKLRMLRAERGWTIDEAADRVGVTWETVSLAEKGRRHPQGPTLVKFARAYEVPLEELMAAEDFSPLDEAARNAEVHTRRVTKDVVLQWGVDVSDADAEAMNRALEMIRENPDLLTHFVSEVLKDRTAA
jgi:transcriptional regulator with XRE-family HTH domain